MERTMGLMAGYGLQLLRLQSRPMIVAQKIRYYRDPEFRGFFPQSAA